LEGTNNGMFMIASEYQQLNGYIENNSSETWKLDVSKRIKCLVWQIENDKLPTKEYCSKWRNQTLRYDLCNGISKTVLHVLRDCQAAIFVWRHLILVVVWNAFFEGGMMQWINFNLMQQWNSKQDWPKTWATTC
jgi:hypothetical protein